MQALTEFSQAVTQGTPDIIVQSKLTLTKTNIGGNFCPSGSEGFLSQDFKNL